MELEGRELRVNMRGTDVIRLQQELRKLGFSIADPEGFFGTSTLKAVVEFQRKQDLPVTGIVNETTAAQINEELETTSPEGFVVTGLVHHDDGRPFAGVVRAFDKDMRTEEFLGEATTDEAGHYEIRYTLESFRRAEKRRADLRVAVTNSDQRESVSSPVIFNAPLVATVNLVVGTDQFRGPSEYEQYVAQLTPVMQNVPFGELREDREITDVSFLSNETGIEAKRIAFLIVAHRFAAKTNLPPEPFYGFFRRNLPPSLPAILAQHPKTLHSALVAAIRENIIPARFRSRLEEILARLRQLVVEHVLEDPKGTTQSSLGAVLSTVLPDQKKLEAFLIAYVGNRGSTADFWKALRDNAAFKDDVDNLQFTLQAGSLTWNHLPLVQHLQGMKEEGSIRSIKDLASLDSNDWLKIIDTQIGFPPNVAGKDDAEKRQNYANALTRIMADAFPTAVIANRIGRDDVPGKNDLVRFFANNPEFEFSGKRVEAFLREKGDPALAGVADKAQLTTQLKGMERVFKVTPQYEHIKTLVGDGLNSAQAIARGGQSAFVSKYREKLGGKAQAKMIYARASHQSAAALALYGKYAEPFFSTATSPASLSHMLSGKYQFAPSNKVEEVKEAIPNWTTLFGSPVLCECEHCRSVYSPTAYFVDILWAFLNNVPSALDKLFERRPDLQHIELSCENTNTPLPYVDLVNEILETAVAPMPVVFGINSSHQGNLNGGILSAALKQEFTNNGITISNTASVIVNTQGEQWTIQDGGWSYVVKKRTSQLEVSTVPQTRGTALELRANPEYIHQNAYDIVAQQVYPFDLPFNLWIEEARTYLRHLGISRHELMEAFHIGEPPTELTNLVIATEYLGLTTKEREIITGTVANQPWEFWGLLQTNNPIPNPANPNNTIQVGWVEALSHVDIFLNRSGLKYNQLWDLIHTKFINPNGTLLIQAHQSVAPEEKETCDPAKLVLVPLDEATLIRMHRFLRLWRKLGWTIRELDQAITAFNASSLDNNFLLKLSHVQRLRAKFKVPLVRMLSWWAPIDTAVSDVGEKSLYEQLFQNKATLNPLDDAFQLSQVATNTGKLSEHVAALLAALGITESDLSLLLKSDVALATLNLPAAEIANDTLSLANLSHLYRITSFAKAQKLSIRDFLVARTLININPFAANHTEDTVRFAETIAKIRSSGFQIAELDYLLRHWVVPPSTLGLSDEKIALILGEMRGGLQKIIEETTVAPDPKGELTAKKLVQLKWEAALIETLIATLTGTPIYAAELAALPDGITFPDEVKDKISYDEEALRLKFTGPMTQAEHTTLLAASDNDDYENAINEIFNAPRTLISQQMKVFEWPTFSADLASLPPIEFPTELKDKVFYHPPAQQLRFVGRMSEAERDSLLALSNESAYQVAVQALFDAPNSLVPDPKNTFLTAADVSQLFDPDDTKPEKRFELVLTKLMVYLRSSLSESFVKQKLAEELKLEAKIVDSLSTIWNGPFLASSFTESSPNLEISLAGFPSQFNALVLLHKISLVLLKFKVQPEQIKWLFEFGPAAGWLDLGQLPLTPASSAGTLYNGWERLVDLFQLRNQLPAGAIALSEIFDTAHDPDGTEAVLLQKLAQRTGWKAEDLDFLKGPGAFAFSFPNSYRDEQGLRRLRACAVVLRRLGVSAQVAMGWSKENLTAADARDIKQAVKSKYENDQWPAIARPLRDVLREKQRAALVSHLAAHPDLNKGQHWKDSNGIYAHYLIDVEMDPCMMTSRIKQANSSLQLFVQRCLMNLEEGISVSTELARQWLWMKTYRVWEANRKVFLYPENWIEPELRDKEFKSPIFQDLETQLLQNELTTDTAENAFVTYLEKLNDVARLDIAGVYHQLEYSEESLDDDGKPKSGAKPVVDVLHVIGRTRGLPPTYYYRQWVDQLRWTPWLKVDVDIEGDHVVPVVANRRLYLFWPVFMEKLKEVNIPDANKKGSEPKKYWHVQIAWSDYRNGKWSAKKVSEPTGDLRLDLSTYDKQRFYFSGVFTDDLQVVMLRHPKIGHDKPWLNFKLGCDGAIKTVWEHFMVQYALIAPPNTNVRFMKYVESDQNGDFPLDLEVKNKQVTVLEQTPGTYALAPPHQFQEFRTSEPFFFEDDRRTYFVTARNVRTMPHFVQDTIGLGPLERLDDYFIEMQKPDRMGPVVDDPLFAEPSMTPQFFPVTGSPFSGGSIPLGTGLGVKTRSTRADFGIDGGFDMITLSDEVSQILVFAGTEQVAPFVPVYVDERHFLFQTFYHPYVCHLMEEVRRDGLDGLLQRPNQLLLRKNFENTYLPTDAVVKGDPIKKDLYPKEDVDFLYGGAYSLYNWELFFHAPLLIATRLSKNQRFEDAQKWFHYMFDPTDRSTFEVPKRFWKTRPFFENADATKTIDYLLKLMSASVKDSSLKDDPDVKNLVLQIEEWRKHPFNPHLIAEMRVTAYQKTVVMKYLDNLIAWGDQLFRRDTIESINEATQLYVLAAEILGKRPEKVPPRGKAPSKTYKELEPDLDAFSNVLAEFEQFTVDPSDDVIPAEAETSLPQFPTLYFCIPKNDKLLGYWDTVEDRLFKIRHCMNIEGVVRQLPLFEPPIDPAVLVRAFAMGVDISSVLNDMNAPLPHYRFGMMAQKTTELCNDVKALGAALLSALEKKDAEELSLLRSTHEIQVLNAISQLKKKQIEEAEENIEVLKKSKAVTEVRRDYYRDLKKINDNEQLHMDKLGNANTKQNIAQSLELAVAGLALIPEIDLGASGWAATPVAKARFGGINVSKAAESAARVLNFLAAIDNQDAAMAATMGGYDRRFEDWKQQEKLANKELDQIDKQIAAAEIRLAMAEQELKNHELQVENAKEADEFMRNKFTNRELYEWMVSQIAAVYFQSYQLAYDTAKRAERSYRFELGLSDSNFIQFGYWDSLKKGLLAGEKLTYDLKRMEMAYLEQHRREYEISKHVSLALFDPVALLKLKETGECFVNLPEAIFDTDYPGHYMRRIKSIGLTIPCVIGAYGSVNCTLTLLKNSVRKVSTLLENEYERAENDSRFADSVGAIQSIVTSSGQDDSGMFTLNFSDERYLPFEGAGAISEWRLELSKDQELRQFDYNTISDVILHVKYTAREGGGILKEKATDAIKKVLNDATMQLAENRIGFFRSFSAKHEFSGDWRRFLHPQSTDDRQTLPFTLDKQHFPFQFRRKKISISKIELFMLIEDPAIYADDESLYAQGTPLKVLLTPPGTVTPVEVVLERDPLVGGLPHGAADFSNTPKDLGAWKVEARDQDIDAIPEELRFTTDEDHTRLKTELVQDLVVVCHYILEEPV